MDDINPLNAKQHYNDLERDLEKVEPAWAKAALYFRSELVWHFGHGDEHIRCRGIIAIWQELESRREGFEAGDTIEVLHAVKICAQENLPLPTWAAIAFDRIFTSTLKPGGPISLDDAFTSRDAPKTEAKKKKRNEEWQLAGKLFVAIWDLIIKDDSYQSLDPAIDRVLADNSHFVIGKTKARELVEQADSIQSRYVPSYQGFSRFFMKRRKQ